MKYGINQRLIAKEAAYRTYPESFIIGKEYYIKRIDKCSNEYRVTTEHFDTLFFFKDDNIEKLFYINGPKENELWI